MTRLQSVLGLHPSARGFGWVLFEGKPILVDCAAVEIRGKNKNARILKQIEALLDKWRPSVIALEDAADPASRRRARIKELYHAIALRARQRGIVVWTRARPDIANALLFRRNATRRAMAVAVAEKIDVLRPKLPPEQKIWMGEGHNMGLFCAAACALCYYASVADHCDDLSV